MAAAPGDLDIRVQVAPVLTAEAFLAEFEQVITEWGHRPPPCRCGSFTPLTRAEADAAASGLS